MYKSLMKITLFCLVLVSAQGAFAGVSSSAQMPEVREIQAEWARLYYLDEFLNANYRELQALARKANRVSHDHPDSAEALVWDAIVLSTLAEKKGGLGALSLVKEAKLKLEQAEAIDPTVLGGSVYASLGSLYAKVPGWPIGFGSDKQDQRAVEYLERALHAPVLVDRPVADQGRRAQARKLRATLIGS